VGSREKDRFLSGTFKEENVPQSKLDHVANAQPQDGCWQGLYKIGAVAALISVVIIPLTIVAFFIWPPFPDDILVVIQEDWLAGLMGLDFMYLLGNVFSIPFFLVLYVTLKEVDESWALVALTLGLLGLVCLVPSRPIPEMFVLSDQYAAAATDAERATCQAAGEAILALFHGMAYHVHYIVGSASLLISSFLMLRSNTFSKATAYVGVVTNVVVFGLYVPEVGTYISLLSVVGYVIWYILIARRLFQLGWGVSQEMEGRL
jgi:hypothetical protein